jgi:hypothetical protein
MMLSIPSDGHVRSALALKKGGEIGLDVDRDDLRGGDGGVKRIDPRERLRGFHGKGLVFVHKGIQEVIRKSHRPQFPLRRNEDAFAFSGELSQGRFQLRLARLKLGGRGELADVHRIRPVFQRKCVKCLKKIVKSHNANIIV